MNQSQKTVGEALVEGLKARDVACVFGIPGVHTVELYRGLAASGLRHVTPRHEQGAGFMADGYARASGKPGVAFVITGPGLTNTLTPMAQARADSVPMLVISGVNAQASLGKGLGHLHELPDQHGLAKSVALTSQHVAKPEELNEALNKVFEPFAKGRPGPTHIQVPLDVAGAEATELRAPQQSAMQEIDAQQLQLVAQKMANAKRPVILVGGGAKRTGQALDTLAEVLDAPVVQTANARGLMHQHPLVVPASPSLTAVRQLIEDADVVLALGTEFGPTDYDMYASGVMPQMQALIRVDLCDRQLHRHAAEQRVQAEAGAFVQALVQALPATRPAHGGAERAAHTRAAAQKEIGADYRAQLAILEAIRDAVPGSLMVGDSTQPIYAGNLYYDHDRAGGWFNAATGYGALGYGIPAAIGASIAAPGSRVICIVGDGGAQFSLPEVMTAVDEELPITFVIWNNRGYREIATSMEAVDVAVVGCDPTPPDFAATARSFGIPYVTVEDTPDAVAAALETAPSQGPNFVEITAPVFAPTKD
ncbi:5-guanidino-2-oxopentanoate decarboxylase [Pseudophaeobacter sp.]|uniref:5-guanidino-2-oxopentanoate decarboxylase n=1 Tax=Pseudophaeobacter sp. TaxID=1971739 RepID=UPI004057D025